MFSQLEPLPEPEQTQLKLLRELIKELGSTCIAYSGGVDSSLVAAIAKEQLNSDALAITGVSPSLAPHLLNEARQQAQWLGINHKECSTNELANTGYSKNPENRCFACKKELHRHLIEIARIANDSQVLDGVNHDDLKDYRPGVEAARQAGVRSPLAELSIGKNTVRKISKSLGFPWWDKPSQPCLASRFPYGEEISSQRLLQVCKAEEWLRNNGFHEVRVRSQGLAARIELPVNQIEDLAIGPKREGIVNFCLSIGFTSVSIDLEGLISGKLNRNRKHNSRKK